MLKKCYICRGVIQLSMGTSSFLFLVWLVFVYWNQSEACGQWVSRGSLPDIPASESSHLVSLMQRFTLITLPFNLTNADGWLFIGTLARLRWREDGTLLEYFNKLLKIVAPPSTHLTVWPLILIWHQPVKSTCIAQMHVRLLKKKKKRVFELTRDLSARNMLQIIDCIIIHLAK